MATTLLPQPRTRLRIPAPRAPEPGRDRFIDVLRSAALVTIVGLHWLMPVVSYDDGTLLTANALATGGGWAITWLAQAMPLIFFAGGAAAAISLDGRRRRSGQLGSAGWVTARLRRLAGPVLPLAVAWILIPHLLLASGFPAQPVETAAALVGRLLWFLAAYVLLVAVTPALLRLHDRFGGGAIAVLGVGAVSVDAVRFGWLGGASWLGYANVMLVWGTIYLAGIHYGRGHRPRPRRALAAATAGLAAAALAVAAGPYPASMIGMPDSALSNMNPPTAVLLGIGAFQLGLVLAVRDHLVRWASRPPVTALLGWLSQRTMTIYLWHTPAFVAVTAVAIMGLGYATPEAFSPAWRDALPVWLIALTVTLAMLTHLAARFERPLPARPPGGGRFHAAVVAVLCGGGLLILSVVGFSPEAGGWPVAGSGALACGVGLASGRIRRPAGWPQAAENGRLVS
jgi:hypothetical protein